MLHKVQLIFFDFAPIFLLPDSKKENLLSWSQLVDMSNCRHCFVLWGSQAKRAGKPLKYKTARECLSYTACINGSASVSRMCACLRTMYVWVFFFFSFNTQKDKKDKERKVQRKVTRKKLAENQTAAGQRERTELLNLVRVSSTTTLTVDTQSKLSSTLNTAWRTHQVPLFVSITADTGTCTHTLRPTLEHGNV